MSRSRVEFLLKEWGQWVERDIDWANEYGDNILYRAGFMTGSGGRPGHKVLCPECPVAIRRIDRQIKRLPDGERDAVYSWYCFIYDEETGKKYTIQQVAAMMGISFSALEKRLKRARRKLRKRLTQ